MKKTFIKSSIAIAFLLGSIGLTGCNLAGDIMENMLPGEEQEYSIEEDGEKLSLEEVEELLRDKELPELLVEGVDQSVLEYRGCAYITKQSISEYELYIVSDSDEKIAEEIRNTYKVLDQYLQSDAYEGEAITIVIKTDSIHCHASTYIAAIGNVDYSYNYYGKKDYYTVEDHISHIEPYGIDEESEIYNESIDYIINREDFWNDFEADCVNFDFFLLG
ncbi:MAG: hypothetical protein J6C06_03985 [Lachnospiraceae bacterium]|nr:hypothetical protein [Lachnospiraceae bacterium]